MKIKFKIIGMSRLIAAIRAEKINDEDIRALQSTADKLRRLANRLQRLDRETPPAK